MKLARFTEGGTTRLGLVEGNEIADLASADERLPADLRLLLDQGEDAWQRLPALAARARRLPLDAVRLEAPLVPRKFLGLGMSFRSHVEHAKTKGGSAPPHQIWFNKQITSVNGPFDPIHLPPIVSELDYEGELALVIGKRGRYVRRGDAGAYIAGYMICNDVSARDWQRRSPTAMLGKSFDTHGPIGPWLTFAQDGPDPADMRIRTWVDGELRQDGNTAELIYSLGEMIEELSQVFTLEPGDILTTGSPIGTGQTMTPPRFLSTGQLVRIEIDGLGAIENPVIADPAAT